MFNQTKNSTNRHVFSAYFFLFSLINYSECQWERVFAYKLKPSTVYSDLKSTVNRSHLKPQFPVPDTKQRNENKNTWTQVSVKTNMRGWLAYRFSWPKMWYWSMQLNLRTWIADCILLRMMQVLKHVWSHVLLQKWAYGDEMRITLTNLEFAECNPTLKFLDKYVFFPLRHLPDTPILSFCSCFPTIRLVFKLRRTWDFRVVQVVIGRVKNPEFLISNKMQCY